MKVIAPQHANKPDFVRRFEREAQIVARLEHPHIVPLYDYWRTPDGAFMVMRYLYGGSAKDMLKESPVEIEAAGLLLQQICTALNFAHRQGVIHRDIKPNNILLDEDGNAYLTDFGIAKDFANMDFDTMDDSFKGTPGYMATEQLKGDPITPRADVYSLGVTLYELLEGHHPFPNANFYDQIFKLLNDPIPLMTRFDGDLNDALNEVIQCATAKNPADRYADAKAFFDAFQDAARLSSPVEPATMVEALTRRQQEILQLIIQGKTNKEIAQELVIAFDTVKWHICQIYKTLKVRNRNQAIIKSQELDLLYGEDYDGLTYSPDIIHSSGLFFDEVDNPYKGLKAFSEADARNFFGREKLTHKLIHRMQEDDQYRRFLAILGPSGSGKSSLVKAGLIPAIWRGEIPGSDEWVVTTMLPGAHPLDELEVALKRVAANYANNLLEMLSQNDRGLVKVSQLILPDDDSELVLVIDQFEELFTLVEDEATRVHFLDLIKSTITDPRSRVRIIVTLRADFYDRPLYYPEFGEILRHRVETVLPLSTAEIEQAIIEPSKRLGIKYEDGLVAHIMGDVNYQAGALPLLQYALTELFERREGRIITHAAYQAIGGTIGALANRADELCNQLTPEGQAAVRQMFMRLVTLGEGTEDTRRRTPRAELLAVGNYPDLIDDIITTFADYRLLALDHNPITREPTVEVAHEAILREWERLRAWLNDSRDDIKLQRSLANVANEWKLHQHDESFLVRGRRLEQFQLWSLTPQLFMTPLEMNFLSASLAAHEDRESEAVAQTVREKRLEQRAYNRLKMTVAILLIASVFGISLTIAIFLQRQSAIISRDDAHAAQSDAEREAEISQSVALGASAQEALLRNDTDLAIALALDANSIENPPLQAWQALTDTVYAPGTRRVFRGFDGPVTSVAFSPDGRFIAAGGGRRLDYEYADGTRYDTPSVADYSVRVFDIETGAEVNRFEGHTDAVWHVKFSPDSRRVYSVSRDNTIRTWSLQTGEQISNVSNGYDSSIRHQRFGTISDDGQISIISSNSQRTTLIDTSSGAVVTDMDLGLSSSIQPVWKAALSPDGNFVLAGSGDPGVHSHFGELTYWDVSARNVLWQILLDGPVRALAFDQTGNYALIATYEPAPGTFGAFAATSIIMLIDVQTGAQIRTFRHGYGPVTDVAFSPDGRIGVSVASDQVIKLWDIKTGEIIETLTGHDGWITDVDFNPNGRQIVTSSEDGTLRLWDIRHGAEYQRFEGHIAPIHDVVLNPQGDMMVSGSIDRTLIEWNVDDGTIIHHLRGHDGGGVRQALLIDHGQTLISGSLDGTIRFWATSTGELLDQITIGLRVVSLAISPDERYLVASIFGAQGSVTPNSIQIKVYDITSGIERYTIQPSDLLLIGRVACAPDGRTFFAVSEDGVVSQWDLSSGTLIQRYDANSGALTDLTISPDGRIALLSAEDRTIIVWDIQSGKEIRRFEGHSLEIYGVDISPDAKTVLTGSADRTVILWDMETGEVLRRFDGHQQRVLTARFSPDGQFGFSAGESGDVVMWRLFDTTDSVLAWAEQNRYIRDLTCEEREFYNAFSKCNADDLFLPRPIYPTLTPSIIPSPTSTLDLTRITATPTWTALPTFTPAATRTLVPTEAPVGYGQLSPGLSTGGNVTTNATSIWTFEGQQDQIITIVFNTFGKTLSIFDPEGNLLTESQDTTIGPITLPATGTYQIAIEATPVTGSYTLTLFID
jgi:WD40 repeat protein/serine/threonine protein kinase